MYSKYICYISIICSLLLMGSCQRSQEERSRILKIYNWADYIDEDVLAEFPEWYKEQTGEEVEIIYQTFDINEIMLTKIERGHEDFDVVCPSEYIIERMMNKDILQPINRNFGHTPDYIHNLAPYIQEELNKMSPDNRKVTDYAVAYMWGTAGTLYNKKLVTEEEAMTWKSLWDPKFTNKILMKDSYRDCYGTAIIYANTDRINRGEVTVEQLMNDNSRTAINTAEEYLKRMKPNIAGWEADFGKEMMTKEKAWLNFTWSGDAVWAIEEADAVGVELDYIVPIEGSNVWFDGWVIPKYARNVKAASYFINYMCRPDIALRNMDAIGYVSAVATPEVLEAKIDSTLETFSDLSYFFGPEADSIQIDPVQYPDKKVIERCAVIRDFSNKQDLEKVLEMWSRVKGDNLNTGIVLIIFAVFGALFVWIVINKVQKYRHQLHKNRRRRQSRRKKISKP
ncbi:MAG: ABC transporter substrate-binding protein [Mediterranea massiliensis]|nr:ABC transporter substrate-binding protein [Mediterranea massiliensis]